MGLPAERLRFDIAAYLAWEAGETLRHEYLAGETFAMAGGSDRHNTLAGNLYLALRQRLRGRGCQVFMNDVKLRIAAADAVFYPDVFVSCATGDRERPLCKEEAVFVAEVLSPSTAAFDRGSKFASYRQLPSLREYLLVDDQSVELYRRENSDHWLQLSLAFDATLELLSLDIHLPVAEICSRED